MTSAPEITPRQVEAFLEEVEHICAIYPQLDPLAGGVLAASKLCIAHDSKSFARMFGIEHALVLRATHLLTDAGLLAITKRSARNQRSYFAPTPLFDRQQG